MVLQDVLDMWLDEKKMYIKQSTYAYYRYEIEHYISPLLGNLPLDDLTEDKIQNIVLLLQTHGIEEGTHIGTNAAVIDGIHIGKWSYIGAGAVVVKDLSDHVMAYGVPARFIKYL